jgi:hypothetical protein
MANNRNTTASKGIFASIEANGVKEEKNVSVKEEKSEGVKEEKSKRSFNLRNSTIKKLQELKVFVYSNPDITYAEIVDEAIDRLYEARKGKNDV